MSYADLYRLMVDRIYHQADDTAFDELVSPDYVAVVGGERLRGPDGFRAMARAYREAIGDLRYTVEETHEVGDTLWARWRVTGVHKGRLLGIPPTHARVDIPGLSLNRFASGKFLEAVIQWDRLALVETLRRASSPGTLYRQFVARVFERGELSAIADYIAADYVAEEEGGDRRLGVEGTRRVVVAFRTAIPNLRYRIDDLVEDGGRVFARWTVTGVHGGPLFGVPATGRELTVPGMSINEFRDGRFYRGSIFWDRRALAKQLGLPLPPTMDMLWRTP